MSSVNYWLEVIIIPIFIDIIISVIHVKICRYFKVDQKTFAAISREGTKVSDLIQSFTSIIMTVSNILVAYLEDSVYPEVVNNNIFQTFCSIIFVIEVIVIFTSISQMLKFRKEH